MTASRSLRVVYLASGNLGVDVLKALHASDAIDLVGVASQPDKPSGRKKRLAPTPVAAAAEKLGLAVDKPLKINAPEYLDKLRALEPDFIVVASFGQILRQALLDIPKYGCFNVHASLLPKYRGASPITEVLLQGEKVTGISFMAMDAGLDTGAVYRQVQLDIASDDTTDTLEKRLAQVAADNIVQTLFDVADGVLTQIPQDHSQMTYAGKITKECGAVVWNTPADILERRVRAYQPWPTVYMQLVTDRGETKRLQLTEAHVVSLNGEKKQPGTLLEQGKNGLTIACGKDALCITRLVPEGKRDMPAADFLRGTKLAPDTIFKDYPTNQA